MRFKSFIRNEGFEIFGYDKEDFEDMKKRSPNFETKDKEGDFPVKSIDLDYVTELCAKHNIGQLIPNRKFIDHVQWGTEVGAVRLRFGTKFDVMMEKLNYDLKGEEIWITKKCFNMNREWFSGKEDVVAEELLKELDKLNDGPLNGPIHDYNDFEKLVKAVAYRTSAVANDPLFFDEIRKLNDSEYIINFHVRGSGLQAPDQRRVEQVMIHMKYHSKRGVIQVIESNVESSLGQHNWQLMPTDFEFFYMPSQSNDEIVNSISTIMKFF